MPKDELFLYFSILFALQQGLAFTNIHLSSILEMPFKTLLTI